MASSAAPLRASASSALLAAPRERAQAAGIVAAPLQSESDDDDVQLEMRRPNLRRVSTDYQSRATPNQAAPARPPDISIRSISFGVCSAATSFSPEWARAARGVDRVFFSETKKRPRPIKTLVIRLWDEDSFSVDATKASSIRITVAVDSVDQCHSVPGGTRILLSLSRPPLFETVAGGSDSQRPKGQQVGSFDDEHSLVVGYASREIMIEFRTRRDLTSFMKEAASAGLPRVIAQNVSVESTRRQDETTLALFQSWLATFDFRVAFQLEKLVRNGLLDAVKVVQLRPEVDDLVADKDAREAERVLAFFADSLSSLESSVHTLDAATTARSEQVAGQKRSLDEIILDDSDSDSDSDSDDCSDSDGDDDPDAVIIVGAVLPYLRGLKGMRASQTSVEELRTLLRRAIDGSSTFNRLSATADDLQLVRSLTVTPTRILLAGPVLADSNTIVRTYARPDCFLTVTFRQEDGHRLREGDSSIIANRFRPLMRQGVDLGGRSWSFLAWSSSGLKTGTCFFMSPFAAAAADDNRAVTPELIHREIGDFTGTETALIPAKYFARISQAFTSSKPSIELKKKRILAIDDVVSHSGSIFSDGVGLISVQLAERVNSTLFAGSASLKSAPTCFQIRLGGAKGMVQVDPAMKQRTIALRPSQIKFQSSRTRLEIAGTFSVGPGFLNRPLIKLLEDLGIHPRQFLKLQAQATAKITNSRTALASAIMLLRDWSLAPATHFTQTLDYLARHSVTRGAAFANPFVSRCLDAAVTHALREIKHSGRIPLPGCYNLVGVLDVNECLGPDEIYAKLVHGDGRVEYVSGRIAISRSPTNHPGDCRIVQGVGRLPLGIGERIRGLHNCVVFSSQGMSPFRASLTALRSLTRWKPRIEISAFQTRRRRS